MNKSTPLNQLPNSPQSSSSPQFVNDQHRHIVNQAQNAVQNFTLPTNTQLGEEYSRDEDTTIQETLMQLNGSDISQAPMLSTHQHRPTQMHVQTLPQPLPSPSQTYSQQQQQHYPQPIPPMQTVYNDRWWSSLGEIDELKIVGLVILVSFVVTLLPIDHMLATYVPVMLSSMPYSDTMMRSIVCGIIFYVSKALLM